MIETMLELSYAALSDPRIKPAMERIQAIKSLHQLSSTPSWQKSLTLKEMKQIAFRANALSSWQSIRTKSEMIQCLQEKVKEHDDFIQTIHSFTFEEYVQAGKDELQSLRPLGPLEPLRKRTKVAVEECEYQNKLSLGVEGAMKAAVHIIPSGSGIHLGNGFILTCAHCVAHDDFVDSDDMNDDDESSKLQRAVELVNARGEIFGSICVNASNDIDLALLKILDEDYERITLGSISLGTPGCDDTDGTDIFALGNPCDTNLENNTGRKSKNGYNPFHVSQGKLQMKITKGRANKCGLGRQIHSAWTYWGHSGCPLISVEETNNGSSKIGIVGIHNSWDDRNGNRHGIPLDEIWNFFHQRESR